MTPTPKTALTIAGSDSGGGAGIQADLRTFFACGVHGMSAVTAVTVQNSLGVQGFSEIPADIVTAQIKAVAGDMGVDAAKTGMLATAEIIQAVAKTLDEVHIGRDAQVPFVVDPVAASMHGDPLLREEALDAIITELFPRATLVTPNLDEVRLLTGIHVTDERSQRAAATALLDFGPRWALVKGGHLYDSPRCLDLLTDGTQYIELDGPRYDTEHTHGGGDTFASAITASLAKGLGVPDAVEQGKRFIERSVAESYPLGQGIGPVSPFWRIAVPE
ncbi:bifunctional hydroxymethylpyrimidine kinase/phosphomethylpyrimidine kinase [Prauserella muralis]|uniref:Bifunctional hydroxymethylpyrimidine kinase/phosphomethylpyrimidine kinase n=1 Tax=Prauserella muralis TaxID=588067 RepID=A0A2V4B6K5_9PSEU|nr:bifunctional hydroxymethylpyrimidine kinase/phosphomethylpyrimidine kinase [Prauserella muralis]PXY31025.1 bifunctional hydroxymethylpyrimidine kinase/phosphomethylpyrimidine kinase [Prauserella muralis]TWE14704.1 hydroxymethylpyrimidine/phosphomethylpyrimidine kinase [Prauserella muralis]